MAEEGTKFTNLAYQTSTEKPRVWARCWTAGGNGVIVHVFRDGGRTILGDENDRQEDVIMRLNQLEGVQNVGEVPDEAHRSVVWSAKAVYVTGYIPVGELRVSVLAELRDLLGEENVILAERAQEKPA